MKYRHILVILLFLLPLMFGTCTQSAEHVVKKPSTIHFIYFSDTQTAKTRKNSLAANHYIRGKIIPKLQQIKDYELDAMIYTGGNFSRDTLESVLYHLNSQKGDIILFLFTGHGGNDKKSEFPQIDFFKKGEKGRKVIQHKHLISIYKELKAKPHKLLIVAAESCNEYLDTCSINSEEKNSWDKGLYIGIQDHACDYLITSSIQGRLSYAPKDVYQKGFFISALDRIVEDFIPGGKSLYINGCDFMHHWSRETANYSCAYKKDSLQVPLWIAERNTGATIQGE